MGALVLPHVHQGRVNNHILVLGLPIVINKLILGVDEVDYDGVVHDIVLVIVLWT